MGREGTHQIPDLIIEHLPDIPELQIDCVIRHFWASIGQVEDRIVGLEIRDQPVEPALKRVDKIGDAGQETFAPNRNRGQ